MNLGLRMESDADILKARDQLLETAQNYRKFWLWYQETARLEKPYLICAFRATLKCEPPQDATRQDLIDSLFVEYIKRWRNEGESSHQSALLPMLHLSSN